MSAHGQVSKPPNKPLLIFDGDCQFCRYWIERWRRITGDAIEYLPFQDPQVARDFAELPLALFERSVVLLEADGRAYQGAEAVFRSLQNAPHYRWLLCSYHKIPAAAPVCEWAYRFVAAHRRFFSRLTLFFLGRELEPPTYFRTRRLFLGLLGLVYFIAFVSLWSQIEGLIGSNGILPAQQSMAAVREHLAPHGWDRFRIFPTLCWISSSDRFLLGLCGFGAIGALALMGGWLPAPISALLWVLYLSLTTVSGIFLRYQWDNLLLEAGFLSIFLGPLSWRAGSTAPVSGTVLWLLRWLLFRLMFQSGCVKLLSGDMSWRDLTAMSFHYETQPLPNLIAWYVHQWPGTLHKISGTLIFGVELAVPFLIFGPRRLRVIGVLVFIVFQLNIFLTGNYGFFNILNLALCVPLLDDRCLVRLRRWIWRERSSVAKKNGAGTPVEALEDARPAQRAARGSNWPHWITVPLALCVLLLTGLQFFQMFRAPLNWARPLVLAHNWVEPFRSFNRYGLFAVMTTKRPEIILEGSNDGQNWLAYEFRYKPGELKQAPRFVAPHQPRLDWQMWFAALERMRDNPWFMNFCARLLEGSPVVLKLLKTNPFPEGPPRYLRARLYEYEFTDYRTREEEGDWWKRELKGAYTPVLWLQESK